MNIRRIKTNNNNFLFNISTEEGRPFIFYTNSENTVLKHTRVEEWEWAIYEWKENLEELPATEEIQKIISMLKKERIEKASGIHRLTLEVKPLGIDELHDIWERINAFVLDNFDMLYMASVKFNLEGENPDIAFYESDYYAPRRVQINRTRLHEGRGLKYADGHKYSDLFISEEQIINTVSDIQKLLNKAYEDRKTNIQLIINKG